MIEHCLGMITTLLESHIRFMPSRSTIESNSFVRRLIENYREKKKTFVVFIDTNVYGGVPRNVIRRELEMKGHDKGIYKL